MLEALRTSICQITQHLGYPDTNIVSLLMNKNYPKTDSSEARRAAIQLRFGDRACKRLVEMHPR